jgi:hypothetical protein
MSRTKEADLTGGIDATFADRVEPRFGPWHHAAIFLFAFAVIVSRRPEAIFHAQPYAEDGHVWYADAYNLGWWPALFHTWTGYFITLPRLAASLSLLVPFAWFPLTLNLIAISFQALPVNLLLSERSAAWGDPRFRCLLAAMYLILPNCGEVGNGITDANYLVGLSAFLLLVASPPKSAVGKVCDICILLVLGLSAVFCIFLFPIAVFLVWRNREFQDRKFWTRVQLGVITLSCAVQSYALLFLAPAARTHRAFGASPALFVRLLSGHVYLATLLGSNDVATRAGNGILIFLSVVAILGSILVVFCLFQSSLAMKMFLLFSGMLFAASLIAPVEWGRPDMPVWQVMAASPNHRYWFFPTLAFAWCLLWCYRNSRRFLKIASGVLLLIMFIGVARDWHHRAFADVHFAESVKRFEAAPAGAVVVIPESPNGWQMTLVKKPQTH